MKRWSYVQFNKYIAECYFNDEFVKKLEDKKLKKQFADELSDLIYKYIFQVSGLSKADDLDEDVVKEKARAKVHLPQWHDLTKDPNDLPKKDCEVIILHENGHKNIQKWENGNWTNAIVIPVIKWCELPKF